MPGTAAGAAGPEAARQLDFDADDWWFRVRFAAARAAAGEEAVLHLGGLATVAEVYVNGRRVLDSDSMFASHAVDVGHLLQGDNELTICCRALAPRLRVRRRPRARWRTRLVADGNLRFYRTMLLGRAPGFAPGPAVVGPWRPVDLERRRCLVLEQVRLRAQAAAGEGRLVASGHLRALAGAGLPPTLRLELTDPEGRVTRGELAVEPASDGTGRIAGEVVVAAPALWWPHTHGDAALYDVLIGDGETALHRARIGFRDLQPAADLERDGPALRINGVPVFVRGAVWTPGPLSAPHAPANELRRLLELMVGAGMNAVRVPGIGTYESDTFYDLCDELGLLVWQDFMFANLDYPEQDADFMVGVEQEARALLDRLGPRPSLAVVCGGSEVAQQVAMLGLDPALANGPLYGELLPRIVREAEVQAPYIPSAPWGGDLPFRPDNGVANYYGVGAYLRPLEDARRSEVRFASECLAFANVPDADALEHIDAAGGLAVHHPAWKAGVPRDAGAGWDFDDVRDHYLGQLFAVDPVALRSVDPDRYLDLSRAVSGEVMAEVLGEWRRRGSPCTGAFVLWLRDLVAGAGWGILDHRGRPKVAYHHLRRALAPVAVWSSDEGLGGILAHVANDRPVPLRARLRVALYRDFHHRVDEVSEELELPPHSQAERNVEALLARFADVSWSYRFGPPAQDLVVVSLEREADGEPELLSQGFRFPAGRPSGLQSADELGLSATLATRGDGDARLIVRSRAFVYGVRPAIAGHEPVDDAFSVEPGHARVVRLRATAGVGSTGRGSLTALNLAGRAPISGGESV